MTFNKKTYLTYFISLFVIGITWHLVLWYTGERMSTWNFLLRTTYILSGLSAGILAWRFAFQIGLSTAIGKTLATSAIGFLVWESAGISWIILNFTKGIESPNGTIVDLFYVSAFVIFGIAAIFLLRTFQKLLKIEHMIEATSIFILMSTFILLPYFGLDVFRAETAIRIIHLIYFMGSSFIFSILVVLIRHTRQEKVHKNHIFFAIAIILVLTAEILRAFQSAQESIWNGGQFDALLVGATVAASIGVVYTIERGLEDKERGQTDQSPTQPVNT
jgi:hypothetical protein